MKACDSAWNEGNRRPRAPLLYRNPLLSCLPGCGLGTCAQVNNGTELAFPHAKAQVQRKVALVASSSNYDADDDVFEVQLPGEALGCAWP